jgi:hypothetical protein
MRWLRTAALVALALLAFRAVNNPRILTDIAGTPDRLANAATTLTGRQMPTGDETAIEARPVRRVRHLQPGMVPDLAVMAFFALAAIAVSTHRRESQASTRLVSRAVPVIGGRGPPPATN